MKKLAIITTHPVQYHVPWFCRLAENNIQVKVFYTWEQSMHGVVFDPGFGKSFRWDIPLLEGYDYEFVHNTSRRPGLDHFGGIINPGLVGQIEEWGAEAVMVIGWNFHSHLRCMRYFYGRIPVYFRGDSVLLDEQPGIRRLARRIFLTWVYRHVNFAFYVGRNNKSYFLRHGLKPSQLFFSPQAIDLSRFSQPGTFYNQQAASHRKKLGIPAHHLTILFAGKLTAIKNPFFIATLADACRGLPVSFLVVGDGKLKAALQQKCKGKDNVVFLGFQNQRIMPVIYRMGDIYLMPSLSETWGVAVNEAMACRRPVIVSEKVGCAVDLVKEGITGITFRKGDTKKCVDFIRALCEDRQRLAEMGEAAEALIQSFSFTGVIDSIAFALRSVKTTEQRANLFAEMNH